MLFWVSDPHLSSNSSGGGGKHIQSSISGFEAHGLDVFEVNKRQFFPQREGQSKSLVSRAPKRQSPTLRDVKWLLKVALNNIKLFRRVRKRGEAFNAVYARAVVLDVFGPFFWRWCARGGPVFVEFDGCMLDLWKNSVGLELEKCARIILKRTLLSCDYVVCYNEANRDFICTKWCVPTDKMVVKSQGVDAVAKQNLTDESRGERVKFVYVGGGLPYHRIDWLVQSCKNEHLTFDLDIYGDGPCFRSVENILGTIESPFVQYHGSVSHDKVGGIYAAADVVIIPGADEYVHPLRLLEALSYGKRVLAPDVKGIASLDLEGVDLFDPEDSKGLIAKMNATTKPLPSKSSALAKKTQQEFSHFAVVENVVSIINKQVRKHP